MSYILSNIDEYKLLISFAKENRKNPTFAEKVAWNALRRNNLGTHFRRQVVVGKYIVDFICIEKQLIIEIDGDSHKGKEEYDETRSKFLQEIGFRVVRFTNDEIINNWEKCEYEIKQYLF